jgi:proteasome lid subunit RPN8/RPN11
MLEITDDQANDIIAHARAANPCECCGLIGGAENGLAQSVYRLRNLAAQPRVTYEAAPEDLFAAQRTMRERGEQLLAIYHSHPRATDPYPSETDVRLAYYPTAVYLIVGLGNQEPCLKAFRISEREGQWQPAPLSIVADAKP